MIRRRFGQENTDDESYLKSNQSWFELIHYTGKLFYLPFFARCSCEV